MCGITVSDMRICRLYLGVILRNIICIIWFMEFMRVETEDN